MDSIWVKIAGAAVVVVLVIVVLGRFTGNKPESGPPEKEKTFYDMADRDKQFEKAPKPAPEQVQPPAAETQTQSEQPAQPPAQPAQPPAAQAPGVFLPSSITQKTSLYFKPLSEEDEIAAEQLLPWASTTRSIGRLPMMSYGPTVRACRDILTRWPESRYAYMAKAMLEDISNSSRAGGFNITQQELDISKFFKQRPGTQKFDVEPIQR